jgi:hypothetical protein
MAPGSPMSVQLRSADAAVKTAVKSTPLSDRSIA